MSDDTNPTHHPTHEACRYRRYYTDLGHYYLWDTVEKRYVDPRVEEEFGH